jgi:hypothetical protein
MRVKGWGSILFHALSFCLVLLCFVWGGAVYAFPSELEIAFAKASDSDGAKSAGCLVVWRDTYGSLKNIYCRYELDKQAKFLREDDNSIVLSDIKLYTSDDNTDFQLNIENWLKNKYPNLSLMFTQNDLTKLASIMSNPSVSQVNFGGKDRVIYQFDRLYEDLPEEKSQYPANSLREFAYLVHHAIEDKFKKDEEAVSIETKLKGDEPKSETGWNFFD